MRRFTLLTIIYCLAFGLFAQTAKEEIAADIHRSASNYYAYPTPTGALTAPPKGYKPFYLSHYARHGSRFLIDPNDYKKPLNIMREAEQNGVLTPLGKQVLAVLDSIAGMAVGRYGELTPLGARQHKGIAERMYKNYPEVFQGGAEIDARSTVVIRCILSMTSECQELQSLNPNLKIKNDASYHDMYYMNSEDEVFRNIRASDEIVAAKKQFQKEHLHPERLMNSLFNNQDYIKWKINGGELMNALFTLASNMQSHDTDLELYSIFTEDECYDLWLVENFGWYVSFGPSPLNKGKIPYMESHLLKNILDTADTCIVKKDNSATLRFGHEVCVMPLACLLELGDCGYQTNNADKVADVWRNYKIFPMACNIQFIFFRKKNSDDILVKVTLNEQEMKLPVKSDIAPYYHWKDVETYYRNKLAAFK
ncbi:histidine-type phosphatase [Parabacteroides bouchesdurhonensis]|uniref:histidine-type phosphatase n=1 Tax=Parabacteroides bouchesdurhonensis TaxID=1936995 RepID=UPI000E4AAF88|nr:histidine-type phosphatase [Parabacteroides bouchesdurhonensis]RHJ90615.1 histidine-type phosphatase [Bacteroides sp. AM07-16]